MKKFLAAGAISLLLFSPLLVFAQTGGLGGSSSSGGLGGSSSSGGLTTSPSSAPNGSTGFTLQPPTKFTSICGLIKALLGAILALGIPIAMLFLVYAGFLFVLARGSATGLQKAKSNLIHVILGIGIFIGAWLLGQIIANTINAVSPGTVSGVTSCN